MQFYLTIQLYLTTKFSLLLRTLVSCINSFGYIELLQEKRFK